jgi:hypothetical protein
MSETGEWSTLKALPSQQGPAQIIFKFFKPGPVIGA